MKKRTNKEYETDTFCFDVQKEMAIYTYLCKDRMNRKQKKFLTDDTKFNEYKSWKRYLISRYDVYSKDCLTEFSRYLNGSLRESNKANNFNQSICISYIAAGISVVVTRICTYVEIIKEQMFSIVVEMLFIPILVAIIVAYIWQLWRGKQKSLFSAGCKRDN